MRTLHMTELEYHVLRVFLNEKLLADGTWLNAQWRENASLREATYLTYIAVRLETLPRDKKAEVPS